MTCDTAKLLLHFARTDLAAEDQAALAAHLASCPGCAPLANRFHAEDAAIATAMKSVTLPIGFRDSLQTQAIAAQAAILRAAWLRRAATATAAVIALVLGFGAYSNLTRPTLESEKLLADFESGNGSSIGIAFDEWRKLEAVPPLPEDFDLRLLTFTGQQALQGVEVPVARFQAGPGQEAVVYFVKNSRFRLEIAADAIGSQGSVRLYRNQPGGFTIVIVHTGNTLAPFLHRPGSAA